MYHNILFAEIQSLMMNLMKIMMSRYSVLFYVNLKLEYAFDNS